MPIHISVDSSKGVLRTAASGSIRFNDLQSFQDTFEQHVQRDGLATELVNLSSANFSNISTNDVAKIARRNAAFLRDTEVSDARFAIFGPDDLQFGLSRVFEAWMTGEDDSAEVRVFRELHEAERWLLAG